MFPSGAATSKGAMAVRFDLRAGAGRRVTVNIELTWFKWSHSDGEGAALLGTAHAPTVR